MSLFTTLAHLFHPRRSNNHRPRLLHPEAFLVFIVFAGVFFAAQKPLGFLVERSGYVLGFASSITASEVIAKTNEARVNSGLEPLTANSALNQAALAKAQHMFTQQYWAHVGPDGTQPWAFFKEAGYRYSTAGENLARDFSNTSDMHVAWMASPTHKANIMNPKYREIGIAVVDGKLLGTETTLVVQLFGTPLSGEASIAEDTPAPTRTVAQAPNAPAAVKLATPQPTPEITIAEEKSIAAPSETSPHAEVLGGGIFPLTTLKAPPLYSPLQLTKAFFLAIIFLIVGTLAYDGFVMSNRNTIRLVGKNLAHILLFVFVAFLLIFFKGGVIS